MVSPDDPVASPDDVVAVEKLLGRKPQGPFDVVVRHDDGTPRVIRNAPFLDDGTPMPTRYWLVSAHDRLVVSRLESSGGVREAEALLAMPDIMAAHDAYEAERDAAIPDGYDGPRPSNGVGGTRKGIKCLHAHYAHWLATNDDAVGAWVQAQLDQRPDGFPLDRSSGKF